MTDKEHTADEWREACMTPTELEARRYATQLAVSTWNKHYRQDAPQWKPLDDLIGVLSQLDNMLAGLTKPDDLLEVVAQILDAGHMNQEDLARLRAAYERS